MKLHALYGLRTATASGAAKDSLIVLSHANVLQFFGFERRSMFYFGNPNLYFIDLPYELVHTGLETL